MLSYLKGETDKSGLSFPTSRIFLMVSPPHLGHGGNMEIGGGILSKHNVFGTAFKTRVLQGQQ